MYMGTLRHACKTEMFKFVYIGLYIPHITPIYPYIALIYSPYNPYISLILEYARMKSSCMTAGDKAIALHEELEAWQILKGG